MAKDQLKRLFFIYLTLILVVGVFFSVRDQTTLSAVAANYIDKTLPHKKNPLKVRMVNGFKARSVGLFAYPIYAIADTSYLLPRAAYKYFSGLFSQEPYASRYLSEAREDAVLAKRSLTGFVSSPACIISADFVTRHFVLDRSPNGKVESCGRYYSADGNPISPACIEEIQKLIIYARDNDRHVSIIGSGLSQGMHSLPCKSDDIVLNLQNFKSVTVNPDLKTANIEAGATWRDIQEAINSFGLAVQVMQASNIFSLGGSISANCHGWDHHAGTISNTINHLTIIDAEGTLRTIKPEDPEFALIIGGYGLCGVIVEAELKLVDNNALIDCGEIIPIENYISYFYNRILPDDSVEMHLYRLSLDPDALLSEGVAQNYFTDPAHGLGVVSNLRDESTRGTLFERVGVHSARKFKKVRKEYWKKERIRIQKPIATTRNDAMRAPINAMFNNSRHDSEWLQEFFIPGKELSAYLKELGALLTKYQVCLINASVRFVKQDTNSLLGYNQEGDRFAVVLCFNQPLDEREIDHTKEWVRHAIDLTLEHGGTYYLPYQHFATKQQFRKAYPKFQKFTSKKMEVDTNKVFSSQFYQKHQADFEDELISNPDHSEIVDTCSAFDFVFKDKERRREFRKFLRNIFLNLNEDAFMKLTESHLKEAGSNEELYTALGHDLSKAKPGSLAGLYRSVKGLWGQKRELSNQLVSLFDAKKSLNGYVEIGFPGRMVRPVKQLLNLSGPSFVIHTEESFMDYIQCGFPRPYDFFFPLNDYAPLTESIDAESADLVSCFIGLHHCPEEKLDAFVKSISDILRPGGAFILRDHNAPDSESKAMAILAHTTFNLGTGVPWDGLGGGLDERTEVRNFQSLEYWDARLKQYGLIREMKCPLLYRPGDPTNNALVKYIKVATESQLSKATESLLDSEGSRKQMQTFLTSVEWHSVRTAKEYASFIEHTPFYMYPYFRHICNFWKLFRQSWSESRRYHSRWEIISSDYFLMNTFIAMFHTVEFTAKGLISLPIAAFYQDESHLEAETIRALVHDPNIQLTRFEETGVKTVTASLEDSRVQDIEMPRYMKFRDLIMEMTESGIEFITIAGQKRIQVQCTVPTDRLQLAKHLPGSRVIGSFPSAVEIKNTIVYLNAEVSRLHELIPELKARGIQVEYVHDF